MAEPHAATPFERRGEELIRLIGLSIFYRCSTGAMARQVAKTPVDQVSAKPHTNQSPGRVFKDG